LSEFDMCYALAIVAILLETPDEEVVPLLTTNPKGFFKSALKHIARKRRADVDRLRAVPSGSAGPYR